MTTTRKSARNAEIPGQNARILSCVSGRGTEQEFSSSYEHLEGDTTGVVDPDVSFEAYF